MAITTRHRTALEHDAVDVPVLLACWRTRELSLAHTFRECAGAATAEIEELYDRTVFALLPRHYESEEKLRRALHKGIKMRALRLHRDRAAHDQALAHAAPVIHATAQARAFWQEPERALIAQEDDMIIGEFLSELTSEEREVFVLMADERSWRAIGTALGVAENEARNATRSCARKLDLFLKLYETGRLCGYRSRTITALLSGDQAGELALEQALAHLRHCRTCRAQHRTTDGQLRATFEGRALAVLPMPVLLHTPARLLDRVHGLLEYPARLAERLTGAGSETGIRERLAEAGAGAGVTTKVALGVAGIAALAGGTLGATHALDSPTPHHVHHITASRPATRLTTGTRLPATLLPLTSHSRSAGSPARRSPPTRTHLPFGPGQATPPTRRTPAPRSHTQHEPGGFAYLGAPTANAARPAIPARAQTSSQHAGGAFSP